MEGQTTLMPRKLRAEFALVFSGKPDIPKSSVFILRASPTAAVSLLLPINLKLLGLIGCFYHYQEVNQ